MAGLANGGNASAPSAADVLRATDCHFFLTTGCNKGSSCEYRHSEALRVKGPAGASRPCSFWPTGACRQGAACSFWHPARSTTGVAPVAAGLPCIFFARGLCTRGAACSFSHALTTAAIAAAAAPSPLTKGSPGVVSDGATTSSAVRETPGKMPVAVAETDAPVAATEAAGAAAAIIAQRPSSPPRPPRFGAAAAARVREMAASGALGRPTSRNTERPLYQPPIGRGVDATAGAEGTRGVTPATGRKRPAGGEVLTSGDRGGRGGGMGSDKRPKEVVAVTATKAEKGVVVGTGVAAAPEPVPPPRAPDSTAKVLSFQEIMARKRAAKAAAESEGGDLGGDAGGTDPVKKPAPPVLKRQLGANGAAAAVVTVTTASPAAVVAPPPMAAPPKTVIARAKPAAPSAKPAAAAPTQKPSAPAVVAPVAATVMAAPAPAVAAAGDFYDLEDDLPVNKRSAITGNDADFEAELAAMNAMLE